MKDNILDQVRFDVMNADCLDALRNMPDCSVDAIVTDPPYGLSQHSSADIQEALTSWLAGDEYKHGKAGFMGKSWDSFVPSPSVWRECFRVLKHGGHILCFAGSRTQDLMSIALRLAGFECRDTVMWVYGCLDEQTELVTKDGVKPYHKAMVGEHILCYDTETGQYDYQPIQEIVEYDYSDTAYRLIGDFGEQVVSRNHRVIVERSGKEVFQFAETLPVEVCVPFLEDLPELQKAISGTRPISGHSQKGLQQGVCGRNDFKGDGWQEETTGESQGQNAVVLGMRQGVLEAGLPDKESKNACMQLRMQRHIARGGVEEARTQGQKKLESCIRSGSKRENDGEHQSCVEWRCNISESKGELFESADKVCTVPDRVTGYGASGRLCNEASLECCESDRACFDKGGVCSSHQSRCDGQPTGESNAIRDKRGSQSVRGWQGHKTAMVRVVPFHYTGKVWCVRVPTGAFVAVRNGLAFPTGNSGFPKSLDVSKAIDKAAGAEREVVGKNPNFRKMQDEASAYNLQRNEFITATATDAARQWQGWGTALKPAYEPVLLFRKPLSGTVAENVLTHGTGALNIDGCRIEGADAAALAKNWQRETITDMRGGNYGNGKARSVKNEYNVPSGRWPANLIHDGSEEPVQLFGYAARFFYCAKASKRDRDEGLDGFDAKNNMRVNGPRESEEAKTATLRANFHPTVKPTDLMRYLCRLITPPNGVILDPFMGSGSTGKAAMLEGFRFIGIEQSPEYFAIARARINSAISDTVSDKRGG